MEAMQPQRLWHIALRKNIQHDNEHEHEEQTQIRYMTFAPRFGPDS